MKKGGLGKGLGAILSDHGVNPAEPFGQDNGTAPDQQPGRLVPGSIVDIPTSQIETNPFQPRTEFEAEALQELADSISTQGIIQPITVRQLSANSYQLISGERRLQASRLIGLERIPAYVRTANDQQMLEMALIENIQRENLNPIEIALSYQRMITEINLKQDELGDRVGKKRSTVTNYLRLLKLPPDIQAGLRDKKISMGHARALVNVEQIEIQLDLYNRILEQDLSVRKVEDLVRQVQQEASLNNKPESIPQSTEQTAHQIELLKVQRGLSQQFSTRVAIKTGSNGSGDIRIPFADVEDLNRILDLLQYQG